MADVKRSVQESKETKETTAAVETNAGKEDAASAVEKEEVLKKVELPSEAAYKADLQKIEGKIVKVDDQIKEVLKKISAKGKELASQQQRLRRAQRKVAMLKKKPENLQEEAAAMMKKLASATVELEKKKRHNASIEEEIRDALGSRVSIGNVARVIDGKIKDLDRRQATTSMSLNEEKQLVKRIKSLRSLKKRLSEMKMVSTRKEQDEVRFAQKRVQYLESEIRKCSSRTMIAQKDLDDIDSKYQEARKKGIGGLEEKVKTLKKEKRQLVKEKQKRGDQYYDQKRAHGKYLRKLREKREKEEKEERLRRRKNFEAELKAWEAEEAKRKPWLDEIAEIDTLLSYLKSMAPKKQTQTSETNTSAALKLNDGAVAIGKFARKGEETISFGRKKKKKRRNRKRNNEDRPIKHGLVVLSNFKKYDIPVPQVVSEVEASIAAAKAKRDYYDTLPRPAKKKPATTTKKKQESTSSKTTVDSDTAPPPAAPSNDDDAKTADESAEPTKGSKVDDSAAFDEWKCYDDDACMGKKMPSLDSLVYVQGAKPDLDKKPTIVLFWAKFLKWQVYPAMKGLEALYQKGLVNVVGIATDPKQSAVERHIEKKGCPTTYPLCFDTLSEDTPGGKVKNAFKALNDGFLKVPQVFLVSTEGTIAWRQPFSSGYPYEESNFEAQVERLCGGKKLELNGPAPKDDDDDEDDDDDAEDVVEFKDPLTADVDW